MRATTGYYWRKDIWRGGGSGRCWAGSRCYRYRRDRWIVVQSGAESVYKLVGVRRGVAKVCTNGAILGCTGADGRPLGRLRQKNVVQLLQQGVMGVQCRRFRGQKVNSGLDPVRSLRFVTASIARCGVAAEQ